MVFTLTDDQFYQNQKDALSDILVELVNMGPDCAKDALAGTIKDWYDYHHQEMQKWKMLEEMLKSSPSWTGLMGTS